MPRTLVAFAGLVLLVSLGSLACGGEAEPGVPTPTAQRTTTVLPPSPRPASAAPRPATIPLLPDLPTEPASGPGGEPLAPELVGITSWINSGPLTLESLRGNVVLIDFWTYTCINCIRTFPYLKEWHQRYADKGLVIIGVHTPEFGFERERESVVKAASKHGLEYAIAQDNEVATWEAFVNSFWPTKYLIDKDGYVRYTHFGEGAYVETEEKIRELLEEAGHDVSGVAANPDQGPELDPGVLSAPPGQGQTRQLFAGVGENYSAFARGLESGGGMPPSIWIEEYFSEPNADIMYEDSGEHSNHFIYMHGLWRNNVESLSHARETESFEDYIVIKFNATEVNVVMGSEDGRPRKVRVTLDDRPLKPGEAGADVSFDEDGNSYVLVDRSDMYRVVSIPKFGGYELKLSSNSVGLHVFAFTFGSYVN